MKEILYVGESIGVPNTAMFIHCHNMGFLLKKAEFDTVYICNGDFQIELVKQIDGFKYIYTKKKYRKGLQRKIDSFIESLNGKQLFDAVVRETSKKKPDAIIYYGYSAEKKLLDFCRKNKIPLFIERVDWFERGDRKGFYQKFFEQRMVDNAYSVLDNEADGIIAISDYIADYFNNNGRKVIKIPPVFPAKYERLPYNQISKPIKLVYCGSVGNGKDIISPAIDAVFELNKNCKRSCTLDLIGISNDDLKDIYDIESLIYNGIIPRGKMNNSSATKIIGSSDFSFLLRNNKRYAKAGFSTKFAESMMLGVPVICNSVGGVDSLIENWRNGIVLKTYNKEEIRKTLEDICTCDNEILLNMKKASLDFANIYFNIDTYVDEFNLFYQTVKKRLGQS